MVMHNFAHLFPLVHANALVAYMLLFVARTSGQQCQQSGFWRSAVRHGRARSVRHWILVCRVDFGLVNALNKRL